jgi:membrane protease YdiL (CAAX protease family)
MSKSFFDEIIDNLKYERFTVYGYGLFLSLILFWVYTAIPSFEKAAMTYMIMMVVWIFGLTADLQWSDRKKENQAAVNGIGKHPIKAILIGLVVGIGFVFVASSSLVIVPFGIAGDVSVLSFLFVVLAAPFCEANFFRGIVQPSMALLFNDWFTKSKLVAGIAAMIITSAFFAVFHVNVLATGNPLDVMSYVPYFIFGIIATVLVYYCKSVAAEYSLHGINNLFAWLLR